MNVCGQQQLQINIRMNDHNTSVPGINRAEPLINKLQQVFQNENLDVQRAMVKELASELGADFLECAAALLYLNQTGNRKFQLAREEHKTAPTPPQSSPGSIKMVRYRLEVGRKHQVTLEDLVRLLVEESGVDKNNINNVNIHGLYTLLELPEGMPPDIFAHLKSVEINQQKLYIKRLKANPNKKRGNNNFRRMRLRNPQSGHEGAAN